MFARTDRLFLRPAWPEDAEALASAIRHEEIVRNLGSVPWPYGIEDAHEKISIDANSAPHDVNCLIFLRTNGAPELIGNIAFGHWNEQAPHPEIGYWITKAHWGKGYATEAGFAMLQAAFLGLGYPILGAGHYVDNPASGTVLRKLGFEPTGETLSYPCRSRGCDVDSVEYSLSRERWLECVGMYRKAA